MNINVEIAKLNPKQREAVMHTEGPLLLLAGAGSGKTKTITMRAAHLLDKGVSPKQVLAVTFTNKAAREMRDRVRTLFDGEKSKAPVISTFHSLCLNILRSEINRLGYQRNFSIFDTSEQMSLLKSLMSDLQSSDRSYKPEQILENISKAKNGILSMEEMEKEDKDLSAVSSIFYEKYQESLKTFNVVDFDDLLLLTLRLFREHPEVIEKYQDRFRYIMVDEYQDTNRVQYDLIRLLAGERRNLCVVGDDDQSIYGWRGANLGNILDFEKDFPGTKVIKLEQNYRSHGYILAVANSVIKNNKLRKEKALWTERGNGDKVGVLKAVEEEDEARWVTEKISLTKYYEPERSYEDFAIIYRSNILSRPFEEALRKERIPYTVVGGTSYFDRKEIKDIAAYLKVIANPKEDLSLLRIANIPKRGLGTTSVGRLVAFAKENSISLLAAFKRANEVGDLGEKVAGVASELAGQIEDYRKRFGEEKELKEVLTGLVNDIGYKEYIREFYKTPDIAIKRMAGVDSFVESIARYAADEESPSLHGFLSTLALTDVMGNKEKESLGVTLISLHSAKGLEFPVVFLVGIEEDILPHKKSLFDTGGMEEERRLFYVGVTRAMERLFITHTGRRVRYGKESPTNPSKFIEELNKSAVEVIDRLKQETPEEKDKKAKAFFANIQEMLGR